MAKWVFKIYNDVKSLISNQTHPMFMIFESVGSQHFSINLIGLVWSKYKIYIITAIDFLYRTEAKEHYDIKKTKIYFN